MTTPYVYIITELSTNKWYIGSRYGKKAHPDDGYMGSSRLLSSLIKLNPDNFKKEILATGTAQDMYDFETTLLKTLDAKNDKHSYNQHNNDFGSNVVYKSKTPWNKGKKWSNPNSKGIKPWNKGKKVDTPAWNKGLTGLKGHPMSEEHKQKIKEIHTGKIVSQETRAKQRETLKANHPDGYKPRLGAKLSDETKKKIGLKSIGRKQPIVTCPHCGKQGGKSGMVTRHFENCKNKIV